MHGAAAAAAAAAAHRRQQAPAQPQQSRNSRSRSSRAGHGALLPPGRLVTTGQRLLLAAMPKMDRERKKLARKETAKAKANFMQTKRSRARLASARAITDFRRFLYL